MDAAAYFFFFNDTATTEIYTLSLHDALPIFLDPIDGDKLENVRSRLKMSPWTISMNPDLLVSNQIGRAHV